MVSGTFVLSETCLLSILAISDFTDINVIIDNGFKDSYESWLHSETSVFFVVFYDFPVTLA